MAQTAIDSLTGVWEGSFDFPHSLPPTPFQAVLLELGETLTGSVWEIGEAGPENGQRLNAFIDGRREGRRVAFIKRYDGTAGRTHAVAYRGELTPDGEAIEGRWVIPGVWTGRFVMRRAKGTAAAVGREAVVGAG